jgi:hypothetical protein
MKWLILIGVVLTIAGIYFWEWAMLKTASKQTPQICTRKPPHACTENGPCNGCPNLGRRTYANGRPTLPSEVESDVEFERRK